MKKRAIFCVLLALFALGSVLTIPAGAAQISDTEPNANAVAVNSSNGIDATSAMLGIGQLVENIDAAFVYEANSETLMYAWNPDTAMYPASIVKIMTALIAVEEGSLEDVITVTESAVASVPFDAVSSELQADEQLTRKDLLYCLLLDSANDAAAVIAEHISGSQEAFVQRMNEYAKELGCTGTNFVNVHGLHDDAQLMTARDAARILAAAMENETFREIFITPNYLVEKTNKSEARKLVTGNSLMDSTSSLYYDPRVIGGRTGVSNDGKRCLAAVSQSNGMEIISIVMGAESVYEEDGYSAVSEGGYKETKALLDAVLSGYKTAQVLYANQAVRQCKVANGDSDVILGSRVSVTTVLPENITAKDLSFQYTDSAMQAPIEAGQKLSKLQIWYGNMCVAETDLLAMNAVRIAGQQAAVDSRNEQSEGWPVAFTIILVVAAGAVVVFLCIRFAGSVRALLLRNRSKQYRRSRRRNR